jgi:CRP-like cAMP-binding protein
MPDPAPDPPPTRVTTPASIGSPLDGLIDHNAPTEAGHIQRLIDAALPEAGGGLRVEEELARGGMGSVHLAFDAALQRYAAAKLLHPHHRGHLMVIRGFLREAQVTSQLDHPNIVPIHELGRDARGELYFTMKLVEGQSLQRLLGGAVARDPDRLFTLLEIFVKLCDALAFAHARGVLHCDIKSANVMIGEFGQVYLMDWGGAQILTPGPGVDARGWVRDSLPPLPAEDTRGTVFGTPAYMSPEQASAGEEPMDERSDVFSMGALLYEIMTGRPPYQARSAIEAMLLAQLCDIHPPDRLAHVPANAFPRELLRIVMKALSRDPEDRHESVVVLKLDIVRYMRGVSNFVTAHYDRGTHVIRQGDVGDTAYIVMSGALEVYQHIDGERVSLRSLGPGDMFGEAAIFAASPRTASVVVLADASLVVVTSEVIAQELKAMKPWMGAFIRTLARRFGVAEDEPRARAHPEMPAPHPVGRSPAAPSPSVNAAAPEGRPEEITVVAALMAASVLVDRSRLDP